MELGIKDVSVSRIGVVMKRGTRDLRLLSFALLCINFGFGAFSAAYTNFIVQVVHIRPSQLGVVEAVRESPGFLIVFVIALTMRIAEPLVAAAAILLFAVGIGAYCGVGSVPSLILWSVTWSIGLHAWMTLQPSMTLALAEEGSKGKRLGQISAVTAFGTICGMSFVLALGGRTGFNGVFIMSALVMVAGATVVSLISKDIGHVEKPRLVFKPRYGLYYTLSFLEGCRKQIFLTFAIFLLVRNYSTPMYTVAALMIVNNVVNAATFPWVGRMIDRLGERKVLAFCYIAAIPVFLGYAYVSIPVLLYVLYCLDNLFYIGSIGSTTYLQKIADPQDVMPSLAMGVSVNHVAAVAVPLVGGLLWAEFGHAVTFYAGAIVAALSVISVLRMKVDHAERRTRPQHP